ncbi:TRAP transporter small permease [Terasakiella sp.]|uniref:TRAP transporter small permease n=1 Tax=Terasakiella sp. TaxID=2034861 RepID=UPI003AA942D5
MFEKLDKTLARLEDGAMIVFMGLAIALTFMQVVMRYVFNAPLFWAEEVVLYSIIVMSFIGISIGIRLGSHISVDLMDALVPEKYVPVLRIIAMVLGILFAIALVYFGSKLFLTTLDRGQLSPALRLPVATIYAIIPIAGVLSLFRYVHALVQLVQGKQIQASEDNLRAM